MSNIIELPRYQCHKQVWALKIKAIIPNPRGAELHFENDRYCPFEMPAEWVDKHQPQTGGYLVVYEGGYRSYSPAEAFESGYVLIDGREVAVGMDGAITGPGQPAPAGSSGWPRSGAAMCCSAGRSTSS